MDKLEKVRNLSGLDDVQVGKCSEDLIINNSSTLANVVDCKVELAANSVYKLELWLWATVGTVPDLDFSFTTITNAVGRLALLYTGNAFANYDGLHTTSGLTNVADELYGPIPIMIETGSTAGTLQLQCAQNIPTAENTIVRKGTCLFAYKVA